ncbi:LPS export ABC transporter periplasmic protein LptC [candidate division WOR-3 bacterium]|nr:LPS export ABC transporter periplasmic protein LptC [candidate division WOR-3 bacterium]
MGKNKNKIVIVLLFLLFSCNVEEKSEEVERLGVDKRVKRFEVVETVRGKIKWKLLSERAYVYEDTTVIHNVHLSFYNEFEEVSSILTSDSAYLFVSGDMRAEGNVVVTSMETDRILKTERLFWEQERERIVSRDSVTIKKENRVLRGRDFESNPDLTEIKMRGIRLED